MGKGADFERQLCRDLSMWWTGGKRDDVFWRSSQSGGRATFRAKSGKKTFGSYGDITATDPIGRPLLDVLTIEAKKGYGKKGTAFDSLDNLPRGGFPIKPCQWELFVDQVRKDSELAGTPFWLLIHRRPQRATMVFLPYLLSVNLRILRSLVPSAIISLDHKNRSDGDLIYCTTWDLFRKYVSPGEIRAIQKDGGFYRVIRIQRIIAS